MRSIPQALLWEMASRGFWQIIGFFIVANAFPLLVYTALSQHSVDPDEPAFVMMHVCFLQLILFMCAVGVAGAQGSVSRLYAAPISTEALVTWHMLPGALVLAIETAVSFAGLNAIFGANYPVAGPAMYAIAAWAVAQLLICVSHRSASSVLMGMIPCVLLFCWLQSRYGAWFSQPTHYWSEVTFADTMTVLAVIVVAWFVTVKAVTRDRCGEPLPTLQIGKWILRTWEQWSRSNLKPSLPFLSAQHAQRWHDWQVMGRALPVIVLVVLTVSGVVFLLRVAFIGNPDLRLREHLDDLRVALFTGGGLLSMAAGLCGFLLAGTSRVCVSRSRNATVRDFAEFRDIEQMGHFMATRPMTDSSFAVSILKTQAKSVVISWCLWAAMLGTCVLGTVFVGGISEQFTAMLQSPFRAWFLPLTLLAAWTAMANAATVMLSGRVVYFICCGTVLFFGGVIGSSLLREFAAPEFVTKLTIVLVVAISLGIIAGTIWALELARRFRLMTTAGLLRSVTGFVVIAAVALWLRPEQLPVSAWPAVVAFSALVVLPFAATPLAISWNRHR